MFFVAFNLIFWLLYILFADKQKLALFLPTCYFALIFSITSDLLVQIYPLWEYPAKTGFGHFTRHILLDFGPYFVVTYFFLQTLPRIQTPKRIIIHLLLWSAGSVVIEYYLQHTHQIIYLKWWNLQFSFISDLILFAVFYAHHVWISKKQIN